MATWKPFLHLSGAWIWLQNNLDGVERTKNGGKAGAGGSNIVLEESVCWVKLLRKILYFLCPIYTCTNKGRHIQVWSYYCNLTAPVPVNIKTQWRKHTYDLFLRSPGDYTDQKVPHCSIGLLHCLPCIANASLRWVNEHWVPVGSVKRQSHVSPTKSAVLRCHALLALALPPPNLNTGDWPPHLKATYLL